MIEKLSIIPVCGQKVKQIETVRASLIMKMLFVPSEVFVYAIFAPPQPVKKEVRQVNG